MGLKLNGLERPARRSNRGVDLGGRGALDKTDRLARVFVDNGDGLPVALNPDAVDEQLDRLLAWHRISFLTASASPGVSVGVQAGTHPWT